MKNFQKLGFSIVLILAFTIFAIAQAEETKSVAPSKVAIFFPDHFEDEKTGIKDLVEVIAKLEFEFKPYDDELNLMGEKVKTLGNELQMIANNPHYRISSEFLNRKVNEYEDAVYKFKSRTDEIKALYEKRKLEVCKDVNKKIYEALKLFAKEKGYTYMLDASGLLHDGVLYVYYDETFDKTKEFIKFYNERFSKNNPK